MALTNTRQWGDKSLKIEQEKEKAGVFREGLNLGLMIAKGEGGVPNEKWDDPSKKKGPFVPPPKRVASTLIKPNQIMLPFVPKDEETDEAYSEGNVPNHPDWSGINNNMMIAGSMKDSLKRENVGNTLRDVVLPPAMREYGKTPSGGYKNPGALLSIMRKLV